jgi:hypothetical protein
MTAGFVRLSTLFFDVLVALAFFVAYLSRKLKWSTSPTASMAKAVAMSPSWMASSLSPFACSPPEARFEEPQ